MPDIMIDKHSGGLVFHKTAEELAREELENKVKVLEDKLEALLKTKKEAKKEGTK